MNNYLYYIKDKNNKVLHIEYRYNYALDYYKHTKEAAKMYAYTKDLFPFKTLIMWK